MWSQMDISREKKKTFTSTLPGSVYEFWVAEAKEQDVSKNVVLAEALKAYQKEVLKRKILEQFADPEYQQQQQEIYTDAAHAREEVLSTHLDPYDA